MSSVPRIPKDKSGLGFNSNDKKSKVNNKKGQDKVKNSAKIICFKCKVEGHHVRDFPLKKKHLSKNQQGKRPQAQANLKLKRGNFPITFKIKLPKSINQR
jgi:hypothetical protein